MTTTRNQRNMHIYRNCIHRMWWTKLAFINLEHILFAGTNTQNSSCPYFGHRARHRLKSPASRLFTQPLIQTQIKENIKASLAFVRGIHRSPVNSLHKWPVTRKMFPFDDVIIWGARVTHLSLNETAAFVLQVLTNYYVSTTNRSFRVTLSIYWNSFNKYLETCSKSRCHNLTLVIFVLVNC